MGSVPKRSSKKVMVAGHVCLDITPVFSLKSSIPGISELLAPGKLLNVGTAEIHTGGAVSNTGLAMKIFGANVTLAGKIGKDQFGQIVKSIFEKNDCANALVITDQADTSYSIVIAIPGIDRIFLHNPGANHTFGEADITEQMLEGIRHFHLGYPPLMRSMYQNDGRELVSLLKKVKQSGATTSLDMAAIDPKSDAGQVDWEQILALAMPYVDFFMPSIEELGYMLDRNRFAQWQEQAKGKDITHILCLEQDVRPLANRLLEMGAKALFIKCGVPGAYYRTANSDFMKKLCAEQDLNASDWVDKEGFVESYLQPNVVSGTGAGDTSIAAFLTSMLEGKSLVCCVQLAAAAGACCVSTLDSLSGLVPLSELEARIEAGWEKENIKIDIGNIEKC